MRRGFYLLPLAIFLVIVIYFSVSLRPGHNIHELPSAMIEKPAPGFDLTGLADSRKLTLAELKGHPFVINFYWVESKTVELSYLAKLNVAWIFDGDNLSRFS